MDLQAIPSNLAKYGPEIVAGQAAADRRRKEFANAWGYPPQKPAGPAEYIKYPQPQPIIISNDPQGVKFWPLMGMAAIKNKSGGAWRAWTLAKNLDKAGQGAIPLADLQAQAKELKIHPKSWKRWLKEARRLGLICDRARADGWLVLASYHKAAKILDCDNVGPRPANLPAADLIGKGWRAFIWDGYIACHGGRPVTRARMAKLTGVPVSTQREYGNIAKETRRHNYIVSELSADNLPGVLEYGGVINGRKRAAPFAYKIKKTQKFVIAWRGPDSRESGAAESLQRGRTKKINKALRAKPNNSLSKEGRAVSYGVNQSLRLFNRTIKQVKAGERKIARADLAADDRPTDLFLHEFESRCNDFWSPVYQPTNACPWDD